MFLLVGLGNPGTEYEKTRHNIGFMVVDGIVRHHSFSPFKEKFKGQISAGEIGGEKVVVLKPSTYMNLSGEAVLSACTFYKLKPENVIVFHDDMDLPVGKIKVKRGGSAGGHNGLKSIDSHIGPNYMRVRIGIGHPVNKSEVIDWVLHAFNKGDTSLIHEKIELVVEHLPLLIQNNEQTFMNRLAGP